MAHGEKSRLDRCTHRMLVLSREELEGLDSRLKPFKDRIRPCTLCLKGMHVTWLQVQRVSRDCCVGVVMEWMDLDCKSMDEYITGQFVRMSNSKVT